MINKQEKQKMEEKDKALALLIFIEKTTGNDFWENWGQYNVQKYNEMLKKLQKMIK